MISISRWIRYIHYHFKNITSFFKWAIHTLKWTSPVMIRLWSWPWNLVFASWDSWRGEWNHITTDNIIVQPTPLCWWYVVSSWSRVSTLNGNVLRAYHTVCHCEVRGRLPGPCFLVGIQNSPCLLKQKNEFPALLTIWIFGEVSCTLCKKCSMYQQINRSFEPRTSRYEGPRINWLGHGHQESGLRVFEIRVSPVIMNRWAISPLFFNQPREQGSQIYDILLDVPYELN